jgi:hypothetical protein
MEGDKALREGTRRWGGFRVIVLDGKERCLDAVLGDKWLIKRLVISNPALAETIYYTSGNEKLGKCFAETYRNHPEHGASAFHIARKEGLEGFERPKSNVVEDYERFEVKLFAMMDLDTRGYGRAATSRT